MKGDKQGKIPNPDTQWQLWYQDTFDRETPRQVEVAGHGLGAGLVALWERHLRERVTARGGKGFARFNLWCVEAGVSIEVEGEWTGQVKLRAWVYGKVVAHQSLDDSKRDAKLLNLVAERHQDLILEGETSERILAAAASARSKDDFKQGMVF
jgi:hypothetical protein